MKKRLLFGIMCIVICVAVVSAYVMLDKHKLDVYARVDSLNNGDAKFWGDYVLTSIDERVCFLDLNGTIIEKTNVKSQWLSAVEGEGTIVYGNYDKQIGIVTFDDSFNIKENHIIIQSDKLCIDPDIVKVNNQYYIIYTEIDGAVNNANPDIDNGNYIVKLMVSDDLQNWKEISCPILGDGYNIEDAELLFYDNHFLIVYEKEILDQGNSYICVKESKDDQGREWNDEKQLLPADCDHEPAKAIIDNKEMLLYYSSDLDNIGASYAGADIYQAKYSVDFNPKYIDRRIPSKNTYEGVCLYDVKEIDGKQFYLCYENGNYLVLNCN